MKKQTAVEWLIQQIVNRQNGEVKGFPVLSLDEIFEIAKEIEKEQIKDAHLLGLIRPMEMEATKQAEQYYNETYGGDK
jgi:hypothetical protein